VAIAKKENHVDGDKIRAILFTRYLSQANKIQKRKMCSKIQEETKEEILAEKNNLDQNMELEDGGTQQQLSRNLQGQKTNKNYANFYASQLPSPSYSQISQGSNLYSEFQSANSES